jgi:hypothetical protein
MKPSLCFRNFVAFLLFFAPLAPFRGHFCSAASPLLRFFAAIPVQPLLLLLTAFALAPAGDAVRAADASGELKPVFNGQNLDGWNVPNPNPFWTVSNGVLIGQNDEKQKGNVLYTEKSYKNFLLETDVRWTGEIDSGIMLRSPELQLQFGVSRSLKSDMTCSFYTGGKDKYPVAGRAKDLDKFLKAGEWNTVRLEAKGNTFTVWLNGTKVTEYTDPNYPEPAPIGLQVHPGLKMKVEFRNIKLKQLD